MSQHHQAIKDDPRWLAVRLECLDRDGQACVRCGAVAGLQVDHIQPLASHPDRAFDLANLQTLCRPCHDDKGREECVPARLPWVADDHPEIAHLVDMAELIQMIEAYR